MAAEFAKKLEARLIDFAVNVIVLTEGMPNSVASNYLASQLTRSSISPALNYAEAQGAESRKDFIHKMSICFKELRETRNTLIIIQKLKYSNETMVSNLVAEANELVYLFTSSLKTAREKQS